jgi:hypothetical protein
MARPAFKRWWTRFVPKTVERSPDLAHAQWRPILATVWQVQDGFAVALTAGHRSRQRRAGGDAG